MSFDRALFGPAGNSISFAEMGYRNSLDTPKYLEKWVLTGLNINAAEASISAPRPAENSAR